MLIIKLQLIIHGLMNHYLIYFAGHTDGKYVRINPTHIGFMKTINYGHLIESQRYFWKH